MQDQSAVPRSVARFPERTQGIDYLAVEEPLEIRIDDEPLVVTMRTPGDDCELAAGFCLTEGVIDAPDDLERVEPCSLADYGNIVIVTLAERARALRSRQVSDARREFYMSSSCGLCGTKSIERLGRNIKAFADGLVVKKAILDRLPLRMREAQVTFVRTGGLHAAALFTSEGELRLLREDVGRHNAVDKIVGALLLSGQIGTSPGLLLVSGRVSFELVQKAARAGIPFLAAVGSPSSLAVDSAAKFGMTLVGFLRGEGRFNIYHDVGRIAV